jgi:hypothetical protein
MTPVQFQMIVKIITNGAPVLAEELCTALATVCSENDRLKIELEGYNTKKADTQATSDEPVES